MGKKADRALVAAQNSRAEVVQGFFYGGLLFIIGIVLLLVGFSSLDSGVKCGSQEMEPGDICQEGDADRSYEEQKGQNHNNTIFLLAGGGVAALGGAGWFGYAVIATVRKRRGRTSVPGYPSAQAGLQPGQQPQQGPPPQGQPPQGQQPQQGQQPPRGWG